MTVVADSRRDSAPYWVRGWPYMNFAFGPLTLRCYTGREYLDDTGEICSIYDVDQPGDGTQREMVNKWVVQDPSTAPASAFHCSGCGRLGIEE